MSSLRQKVAAQKAQTKGKSKAAVVVQSSLAPRYCNVPLSDDDRRLIDEAIAAGRVTKVPMGGFPGHMEMMEERAHQPWTGMRLGKGNADGLDSRIRALSTKGRKRFIVFRRTGLSRADALAKAEKCP